MGITLNSFQEGGNWKFDLRIMDLNYVIICNYLNELLLISQQKGSFIEIIRDFV